MPTDYIKELSIHDLFSEESNYLIPIYQRNYAWTKVEVEQLVTDINDYSEQNKSKDYYIGTLVTFKRNIDNKDVYETIDGQQRLTTLSILLSILKHECTQQFKFNHLLKYESRGISTKTLESIYNGNIEKQEDMNYAMENAYKVLKNYFKKEEVDKEKFRTYLLNNVKILRVEVPKDTDLNHYFEIMNNRGEQLEKHEVLKARMIKKLTADNDKKTFNTIWEACSDMYRYVQYGFSPIQRDKVFGTEWDKITVKDFNELVEKLNPNTEDTTTVNKEQESIKIDEIILDTYQVEEDTQERLDDDKPDRFTSTVSFPNFLLHVLKITDSKEKVPLDDKRLLDTFKDYNNEFVKTFGYNLLKMRFLFDNYIIKREYTNKEDDWSLKQAYKYTNEKKRNIQYKNRFDEHINKKILMILSMFHVSNPSQIYKYWLTGALKHLKCLYEKKQEIKATDYLKYLEKFAELFLKNRYLSKESQEFETIIFDNPKINDNVEISFLNKGTAVEHFIFNYLDYLLWKNDFESKEKRKFDYFRFSFSNSVEHFYPQNPIEGHAPLSHNLDDFGNLCLISVSKNAKLNNHPPKSKKEYYKDGKFDSLKQHVMMEEADAWNKESIEKHQEKMIEFLKSSLS